MSLKAAILDQRRAACKTFCMKRAARLAVLLAFGGLLCGTVSALPPQQALPALRKGGATADPFGYCKASGTSDSVRQLPRTLKRAAAAALGLPPGAEAADGYFWRCMDGAVYVCSVGANIPCQSKADAKRRNAGAEAFCREKPDADSVPAYATGHSTIYEWRCVSGAALRGKRIVRLDRRGFQADFWSRLEETISLR
jgi:hypothetical protein